MNKKFISMIMTGATALVAFSAYAQDTVLATYGGSNAKASAKSVMNLDIQSSGQATAFQFLIDLPKGVTAENLNTCGASAPRNFVVTCRTNEAKNKVAVVGYSPDASPLPSGIVELGRISLSGGTPAKSGGGKVSKVEFSGSAGTLDSVGSRLVNLEK